MQQSRENLKFELLKADHYSPYLLHDRREILQVLKGLVQRRCLLSAYVDGTHESFLTSVLAISPDEQSVMLDPSRDEGLNDKAVASERTYCVTQLDNVKIQFAVSDVGRVPHEAHMVLQAPLPEVLLRLQRREYFRLPAPPSHALTCVIPIRTPDGKVTSYEARVLDISGGGVAVMVPPQGVEFSANMVFEDCRILLPDSEPIHAGLRVRNVFRVTNRNGVSMVRAGCEFIDMSPSAGSRIHRYVLNVERERSARARSTI
jgi:c-di-GMP-binding flagellar brake protein YcgR